MLCLCFPRIIPHCIKHYPGVVLDVILSCADGHVSINSPMAVPGLASNDTFSAAISAAVSAPVNDPANDPANHTTNHPANAPTDDPASDTTNPPTDDPTEDHPVASIFNAPPIEHPSQLQAK